MVTAENVSAFNGLPLPGTKIPNGPCYALSDVQALASSNNINLVTRDAHKNALALGFDNEDIGNLILELAPSDYKDSAWCSVSEPNKVVAADAYKLKRVELDDKTGKNFQLNYYLKFAISKNAQLLMLVSNHLSA